MMGVVLLPPVVGTVNGAAGVSSSLSSESKSSSSSEGAFGGAGDKSEGGSSKGTADGEVVVTTIFVTHDHGVLAQDSLPLDKTLKTLMGLKVTLHFDIVWTFVQKASVDCNVISYVVCLQRCLGCTSWVVLTGRIEVE